MASPTTFLIERGERRAQELRPATLTYAGVEVGCTPGNLDFFQRLKSDGGGFQSFQNLFVKIIRSEIPAEMLAEASNFKRGHSVQVTDTESGDVFGLIIGENNSRQAALFTLNLEKQIA